MGTPLYNLYRYVPPQRVSFLSRFGLKTVIDFDHYGLKSGMVFKETTRAYKRIILTFHLQGPVVRKQINPNPRLKVNQGFHLTCLKWFKRFI